MKAILLLLWLWTPKVISDSSVIYKSINETNTTNETICAKSDGSVEVIPVSYKYIDESKIPLMFSYDIITKVDHIKNRTLEPKEWFCTAFNELIVRDQTPPQHSYIHSVFGTFRYLVTGLAQILGQFGQKTLNLISCVGFKEFMTCSHTLVRCSIGIYATLITGIAFIPACIPVIICGADVVSSQCVQRLVLDHLGIQ